MEHRSCLGSMSERLEVGVSSLRTMARRGLWIIGSAACRANWFWSIAPEEAEALFHRKHFHEHLVARHTFSRSHNWTKTFLHSKGLLEKARRASAQAAASANAGEDAASGRLTA
jgi:hypothetical protein